MATPAYITEADFVGRIELTFCEGFPNDFAAQYEADIMRDLLGYHLFSLIDTPESMAVKYRELMQGSVWTDASGYEQRHEGIIEITAYLVYYYLVKEFQGKSTGKGMIVQFPEVGTGTPSNRQLTEKAVRAWSIAYKYYLQTVDYIDFKNSEEADYFDNFEQSTNFEDQNIFGI